MDGENNSYNRNRALLKSAVEGTSSIDKVTQIFKKELQTGELIQSDILIMFNEIYTYNVKPFSPIHDKIFEILKSKIGEIL